MIGSSDNTSRLWDLRVPTRKSVMSIRCHSDSVWAQQLLPPGPATLSSLCVVLMELGTSPSLVSCGRDGRIFLTDLRTVSSSLLHRCPSPILAVQTSLNASASSGSLWISQSEEQGVWELPLTASPTMGSDSFPKPTRCLLPVRSPFVVCAWMVRSCVLAMCDHAICDPA